jgi:hypothetical protein
MLSFSIRCGYRRAHFGCFGFEFAHSLVGQLAVDLVIGQSDGIASTSCLIPMISMIVRSSFLITLPEQLVTTAKQRQRSVA